MPGKRLSSQAQSLVINLLEYFTAENENGGPLININSIQERVAGALKISVKTVSSIKIRKEKNPILRSPGKSRPRAKPQTADLAEPIKMAVRDTVYTMYKDKKHVTIATLNRELKERYIINVCDESLRTLMRNLEFKYKKDDNRRALFEKTNIAALRTQFLRLYQENCASHLRQVVFLDETWIFSKGSARKSWQDENVKSVRRPKGVDGKRFIILHAGNSNGFIENASLIFSTKSTLLDYHGSMSSDLFTKWFIEKLIPNLHEPSLIVMDNAPYHSVLLEKQPGYSWKKADICDWLNKNNIPYEASMLKSELLQLAKEHKKPKLYMIDQLLQENGHEVLRLPPYHCQFNAIELIWASAKTHYDQHIGETNHSDSEVLRTWERALQKCSPEEWRKCIAHTNKIIQEWFHREVILDDIPQIVIQLTAESDSESDLLIDSG